MIGNPLGKSGGSLIQQALIFGLGSLAVATPYLAVILAAIVVGLACSAIVTACAWLVAKPARACLLFVALAASLFFGSAIDAANMYGVPLSVVLASGAAFIPRSAYVAPALCLCAAAAGGFFAVLEWVEGKRFEKMVKADIMSVGAVRSQSGRHLL